MSRRSDFYVLAWALGLAAGCLTFEAGEQYGTRPMVAVFLLLSLAFGWLLDEVESW